jgi:hypothetical protein
MRIGMFPGQEEALRNELRRLHMLGRRRFLYLALGVVAGGGAGLVAGKVWREKSAAAAAPTIDDDELHDAIDAARGPLEGLRKHALLLIFKFNDYPDHPLLHAGLIRLADALLEEPASGERRALVVLVLQSLERSPSFATIRETSLFGDLQRVARTR